ncbi:hypothetical protein D3C75_720650 [compost metagenome]
MATLPLASVAIQVTLVVPTGKSIGASLITVTLNRSVTIGWPRGILDLTAVASTVRSAGAVRTGLVVSTTLTFCVPMVALPCSSVTVQVTSVVPSGKSAGALFVTVTGKISVTTGWPISTFVLSPVASAVLSPGSVTSGLVVSVIVTVCVPLVLLPFSSVAVQVTSVLPTV